MRPEIATTTPCPSPTRPPVWETIRAELYPALRQLGLAQEAATAAAERGADAAIVEARLITLNEARRWGRPFTGEPVSSSTTPHGIPVSVLAAFANFEAQVRSVATFARMVDALDLLRSAGGHVSQRDADTLIALVTEGVKDLEGRYDGIWAMAQDLAAGKAVQS